MNRVKSFTLLASLFFSSNACFAATLVNAEAVKCPTNGSITNLKTTFASNAYTLKINSATKFADGLVGLNFPSKGSGKFPNALPNENYVNKFTGFQFKMTQSGGPVDAAYPFTVVVQDKNDGFYHACNGLVTGSSGAWTFNTNPVVGSGWAPQFQDATPFIRKLALTFSGDFTTPVTTVTIPITSATLTDNPIISSSILNNTIPNTTNPNGPIDFQYDLAPPGAQKFNFDTNAN